MSTRPWTLKEHCVGGDENRPTGWYDVTTDDGMWFGVAEDVARRIVTAVNTHDELAEALRAIVDDEVSIGNHATQALISKGLIAKGRAVLAKLK